MATAALSAPAGAAAPQPEQMPRGPAAVSPGPVAGSAAGRWRPAFGAARSYASDRLGSISFAVIDHRGRLGGKAMRRAVPAASVFKVMLLVAYLRRRGVAARPLRGWERRLLVPMVRRSDDVAATRVRDLVGRHRILRLAKRARMRDFSYHPVWGMSLTSARDQARFMHRLGRYLPDRHRRWARWQLRRITPSQRWGVARVRHPGWRLHFKGGWGSGSGAVDHQVALLRGRGRSIALAIMTTGSPSHAYGKRSLQGVAARLLRGLPRPYRLP